MLNLVKVVRTCIACPSQWDAWDEDGDYWYLRYRSGIGTVEQQPSPDPGEWIDKPPVIKFFYGDSLDGYITLEKFMEIAEIKLAPNAQVEEAYGTLDSA